MRLFFSEMRDGTFPMAIGRRPHGRMQGALDTSPAAWVPPRTAPRCCREAVGMSQRRGGAGHTEVAANLPFQAS